jgi:hypothetical protein
MPDNRSPSLFDIWQEQLDDSTKYWQSFLSTQTQNTALSAWWQPLIEQNCTEWSALLHQWQQALMQWLENGSNVVGCTLQSEAPFGAIFPPLEDLSRLNKIVIDLMGRSTDGILAGFDMLSLGRVSALTDQIGRLETAVAEINQHLDTLAERLHTSDASVTQQVDGLRDQVQTAHDVLSQYLEALTQRLDELGPSDTNPSPRPATRRRPKP